MVHSLDKVFCTLGSEGLGTMNKGVKGQKEESLYPPVPSTKMVHHPLSCRGLHSGFLHTDENT